MSTLGSLSELARKGLSTTFVKELIRFRYKGFDVRPSLTDHTVMYIYKEELQENE